MVAEMRHWSFVLVLILAASDAVKGKRKHERMENNMWKKEYEEELSDAMLAPKRRNNGTRGAQSPSITDDEAVVEKLVDSITSSEKYLKKIESIDFRLNRLDIEVHEKTNTIMNHITEVIKTIQSQTPPDKLEMLDVMKSDIDQIKHIIEHRPISKASGINYFHCIRIGIDY